MPLYITESNYYFKDNDQEYYKCLIQGKSDLKDEIKIILKATLYHNFDF